MSTIHLDDSVQSVVQLINRFVDDLLVKIFPAGAQSVVDIVQVRNRSAMHALLHAPYSVDNRVQVRAAGAIKTVR